MGKATELDTRLSNRQLSSTTLEERRVADRVSREDLRLNLKGDLEEPQRSARAPRVLVRRPEEIWD